MRKCLLLSCFCLLALGNISIAQYENIDFEPGGLGAGLTWIMDQNDDNPPLEFVANPVSGGINTTANVAKFTARVTGAPWALTYTDDLDDFMFDATNSTVTIMVHKTVMSDVAIKFEGASAPVEIKIANTTVNQWEEITFDFSGSIGNTYSRLVIIPDFDLVGRTQENIIYFDNVQVPEGNVMVLPEPTVAAPIPTHDEVNDNVLSIFSNTYTDVAGTDFDPNWGQVTDATIIDITGNSTLKYENLNYQGTQFTAQDVSAHGYIHVDFWTPNAAALEFYLISQTTGERKFDFTIATEQWVSVDIPLNHYTGQGLGLGDIFQFKVVGNGNVWFDNWYFHSDYFENEPTMAAPTPTHDETTNNVISIFSDSYTDVAGTDFDPNWGQATDATIVPLDGGSALKYAGLNYQGTQFGSNQDVSTLEFLHVDFWTSNSTDLGIYLISPGNETEYVFTIVPDQWNSIDIPLAFYSPPVDLSDVFQFKVEGNGTVWLDNLYFFTSAPAPVELVSFEANTEGRQVELNWKTASEVSNDFFRLQRSIDDQNYETIEIVQSTGNSTEIQSYSTVDKFPNQGINYYRLEQVDLNGHAVKSNVASAVYRTEAGFELVKKVVVADQVQLTYNITTPGEYKLDVVNINGQLIDQQTQFLRKGTNEITIHAPQNGIFIVALNNELDRLVEKIFK